MKRSICFNLYDVLNVPITASTTEIKAAFRSLALKHHPDKHHNSSEATATFKTINNAYAVLSNPETRERYDRVLDAAGPTAASSPSSTPRGSAPRVLLGPGLSEALSLLFDHLNFVLWDIEDFITSRENTTRGAPGATPTAYLFMMLTFIDRWVLQPAGVPDYFFQARGLKDSAPIGGSSTLPYQDPHGGHRPYTDITDYFYNVRRRVDELFRRAKLIDFSAPIAGTALTLADCVLEAHNYCIHYLGWMTTGIQGAGGIPPFHHSQSAFREPD